MATVPVVTRESLAVPVNGQLSSVTRRYVTFCVPNCTVCGISISYICCIRCALTVGRSKIEKTAGIGNEPGRCKVYRTSLYAGVISGGTVGIGSRATSCRLVERVYAMASWFPPIVLPILFGVMIVAYGLYRAYA